MPYSTVTATSMFRSPYIFSGLWSRIARKMLDQWGVVWGHAGGETFFVGVLTELFRRAIYYAKSIPYPGHQYGSRYCRVLGGKALWIMQ